MGRPGMEQWKILVLGVLRLGLNADYDRIHATDTNLPERRAHPPPREGLLHLPAPHGVDQQRQSRCAGRGRGFRGDSGPANSMVDPAGAFSPPIERGQLNGDPYVLDPYVLQAPRPAERERSHCSKADFTVSAACRLSPHGHRGAGRHGWMQAGAASWRSSRSGID